MRRNYFAAPPFVVWHIAAGRHDRRETPGRRNLPPPTVSEYVLVPHGVYRDTLAQAFVQWVGLGFVLLTIPERGLGAAGNCLVAFLLFFGLAILTNIAVLWQLNSRAMQPIEALLLLCPANGRENYNSA